MPSYRIGRHPLVTDALLSTALLITDYPGAVIAFRNTDGIEAAKQELSAIPHAGSLRVKLRTGHAQIQLLAGR